MKQSNLQKYFDDFESLVIRGELLLCAMKFECGSEEEKEKLGDDIPNVRKEYQMWYSESKALIGQILPDRLNDFVGYYEKSKQRKEIDYESYCIEDYLPLQRNLMYK